MQVNFTYRIVHHNVIYFYESINFKSNGKFLFLYISVSTYLTFSFVKRNFALEIHARYSMK